MSLVETTKNKTKLIFYTYAIIFIPMWTLFIFNNLLLSDYLSNIGGIHPRTVSILGFTEIMTSWMFHGSGDIGNPNSHIYDHILGNSIALLGLLFIVGLIESKPIKLLAILIFGSGLATWLIGSNNTVHIGASGLIFALFGYILSSVLFGRRWVYLIPIFLMGGEYFYSLKAGLIPQDGVSFSAHFGGFIAGIITGYLFNLYHKKIEKNNPLIYKNNLKEKCKIKFNKVKAYFKLKAS